MVLEKISTILTKEECKKVLLRFDKNKELIDFKINKYSENVVGFLAEHYLLTIYYSDKNDEKSVSYQTFFLKSLPLLNEKQKNYVKHMDVFIKEILMYKNLLSEFSKLASKQFAPKYYFSQLDQCIVMEDISSKNYQVSNMDYLDYGKVKGALEALARFHAASIIFEECRSTKDELYRINEHFPKELTEGTFSFKEGHVRNMWCKSAVNCLEDLSKFFTENCEVGGKIKKYVFSDRGFKKFLLPSEKYRNVVCHDDLWRNNMMFNENNECLLLDFQLTRYSPPIFDVLLLLLINVEETFLNEKFHSFLQIYYESFKSELTFHDIDIDEIWPRKTFLESVDDYTLPALVEACMYGTNVYLPEDTSNMVVSNMDTFEEFSFKNRSPFVMKDFECNEKFRKRFSNVLRPLYEMFREL